MKLAKKAQNKPSTRLIEATSFVEKSDTMIEAEDLSLGYLSSYQTLTMDKNCWRYKSPKKLVEKLTVVTVNSRYPVHPEERTLYSI